MNDLSNQLFFFGLNGRNRNVCGEPKQKTTVHCSIYIYIYSQLNNTCDHIEKQSLVSLSGG